MTYLFDTNVYLWLRSNPARLPGKVFNLIADTTQQGTISIVNPCEIALKTGSRKLDCGALLVDFEKRESAVGFSVANLTIAQAIRSSLLPRHHSDLFDRLLIAQALDLNIPILSSDHMFGLYGVQRFWD